MPDQDYRTMADVMTALGIGRDQQTCGRSWKDPSSDPRSHVTADELHQAATARISAVAAVPDFCPAVQSIVNEGRNIVWRPSATEIRSSTSGPVASRSYLQCVVITKLKGTKHGTGNSKAHESSPLPSRQGYAQPEQEGTRRSRRGYGYITTESKTDKPG